MTLLSLLILYIYATAIAAPPTLPFLPLQSDVKNPDERGLIGFYEIKEDV